MVAHDLSRYIRISPYTILLTHSRFFLSLRSGKNHHRSLILFRLSASESHPDQTPLFAIESSCPHLGADLSHAEIEECESTVVAVCPWHRYDFDLRTGESETGLKACTYAVCVAHDPGDDDSKDYVWVEKPPEDTVWRVVELRPVSEEFADQPSNTQLSAQPNSLPFTQHMEPVVPTSGAPETLVEWAVLILNTPNPSLKVARTRHAVHLFLTGALSSIGHLLPNAPTPPIVPLRESQFVRNTVDPAKVRNRKNRAVMLHALANIEQWAIDLAWDAIARFGPTHPTLPPAFFTDFARVALDESKHFTLLVSRLAAISPSTPFGSLPVHAALWDSALTTASSLRARLAIVHLVHEARGLDVNPGTIARFRRAGDEESAGVLEIVHADEVVHVATGHRWFTWVCTEEGVADPVEAFREEVRKGWKGEVKGPFNATDRERAGMTRAYYEDLRGEMVSGPSVAAQSRADIAASVAVEYENESAR